MLTTMIGTYQSSDATGRELKRHRSTTLIPYQPLALFDQTQFALCGAMEVENYLILDFCARLLLEKSIFLLIFFKNFQL